MCKISLRLELNLRLKLGLNLRLGPRLNLRLGFRLNLRLELRFVLIFICLNIPLTDHNIYPIAKIISISVGCNTFIGGNMFNAAILYHG